MLDLGLGARVWIRPRNSNRHGLDEVAEYTRDGKEIQGYEVLMSGVLRLDWDDGREFFGPGEWVRLRTKEFERE